MSTTPSPLPRVAAVLVVHDGEEWLPSVLATLAGQSYPALDLVAVDNASTDGSLALLDRRIPPDKLIRLERDAGFGRAVAAALQHEAVAGAELVLLVHDDLVLAPDAITRMVHALRQDSELAIVGPKLREWSDDDVLQEVGMTVDRFGRAENRLEPGELDQGQHDRQLDVLYVSTAGMMIRLDALRTLGGFDARMPAFREDLDLCWRAWLAGKRVAVVPAAVGYHIAAASRLARPLGRGRPWEARYLAERHTIATMVKNYSAPRLLWILPVVLLLAIAKTAGFMLTRRFGDAVAVLRAYAWNVVQLGRTLRRRRIVQSRRQVGDAELGHLFAPGLPRARAYAEALGSWLAGGSTRALLDEAEAAAEDTDEARALVRLLRGHPVAVTGAVLLVVYAVGLVRFLADGQILGGDIAPWPSAAREFLASYVSPWNGGPAGSAAFASPIQAALGLVSFLGLGSAWLAQRLVVFGLLPLGWVLALRAGRLVTPTAWPRILGATLYALSPVLLGALAQGRIGVLVLGALLPGLVLVAARAADPATGTATAWRSAALLALGLVAAASAAPVPALPVVGVYAALLARAVSRRAEARQPALTLGMAGLAALALLAPWLVGLLGEGAAMHRVTDNPPLPFWRAFGGAVEAVPGLGGLAGALIAASAVGLVIAAVLLGLAARPVAVTGLVLTLTGSALAAWAVVRAGADWVWAPALLLPGALALAGLGVVAAHYLSGGLRRHAFGVRQLAVLLAAGMLTLGLAGGVLRLASGPWDRLELNPEVVPAFVGADVAAVGPYRVLLVDLRDGVVWWDLVAPEGPAMTRFGSTPSRPLLRAVDEAVAAAVGGADLRGGVRLGLLNVRYVVLQGERPAPELVAALARQPALEPLPSGGGRVFRVDAWLPRVTLLPPDRADALRRTGDFGAGPSVALRQVAPGRYRGPVDTPGLLVISEATSPLWRASSRTARLERVDLAPVNAFAVPEQAEVVEARTVAGAHLTVALLQLVLLLGVVSLALRPPGFTQARVERRMASALPSGLARDAARAAAEPEADEPELPSLADLAPGLRAPEPEAEPEPGPEAGPEAGPEDDAASRSASGAATSAPPDGEEPEPAGTDDREVPS